MSWRRQNQRWPIDGYRIASTRGDNGLAFKVFKSQLKPYDLGMELLGRLAQLHPLEARNLHAQRVDEDIAGGNIGVGSRSMALAALRLFTVYGEWRLS